MKPGDFIMSWHVIYMVKKIRDDGKWIDCTIIKWNPLDNVLEIENKPMLITIYNRVTDKLTREDESSPNTIYAPVIRKMIKMCFEYSKGR